MSRSGCWICSEPEIVYTDVLGLAYCREDYDDIYLGSR